MSVSLAAETPHAEPLPLDPLGKQLCETFPYLWNTIISTNETTPKWQTVTNLSSG